MCEGKRACGRQSTGVRGAGVLRTQTDTSAAFAFDVRQGDATLNAPARSKARMIASISTLAARFAPSSSSFAAVGAEHCAAGDDAATTSSLVLRALALDCAARAGVVLAISRKGVCTSVMRGGDGGGDGGRRRAVRMRARVRAQVSSRRLKKTLLL